MRKLIYVIATLLCTAFAAGAQTNLGAAVHPVVKETSNPTNQAAVLAARWEVIRNECIRGRRTICGRVVKILPEGLVVDSGYTRLLQAPYNQSWLVSSGALVPRDPKTMERNEPGAACIGPVFLSHYPKRPAVKLYDYIILQVYPVGPHAYTSVPGVEKSIRNFSAGLDTAIRMKLAAGEK